MDKYKAFAISGGEPLIDLTKLAKVLSVLLGLQPDKLVMVNTNATYLF